MGIFHLYAFYASQGGIRGNYMATIVLFSAIAIGFLMTKIMIKVLEQSITSEIERR